jgi:hypothetical protein
MKNLPLGSADMTAFNNRKVLIAVVSLSMLVFVVCIYSMRRYKMENQPVVINLGTKVHPRYWKITRQQQEQISAETHAEVEQEIAKMMQQRRH